MKILILEDDMNRMFTFNRRYIFDEVYHALSVDSALKIVNSTSAFDLMTLDHDLKEAHYHLDYSGKDTGLDFVERLLAEVPKEKWPKKVEVHSYNIHRAPEMVARLNLAGIPAMYKPFQK